MCTLTIYETTCVFVREVWDEQVRARLRCLSLVPLVEGRRGGRTPPLGGGQERGISKRKLGF